MARSTKPEAYLDAAASTPLFIGVEKERIQTLLSLEGVVVRHYTAGETIYSTEGYERALGFLVFGEARVVKCGENGAMPMSVLKPGALFGAAAIFNGDDSYVADVRAMGSTWAVLIPQQALEQMMRMEFAVGKNYICYLTERIRFLSARLDGFVPTTVEERLLAYVRANAKDGTFVAAYGFTAVAEALRVSRATMYRACDALQAQGKLIKEGKTLRLTETSCQ